MAQTDNQRIQILETVFAMASQRGLKGVVMDDVASELTISKRTIYELFSSKKQILMDALDHFNNCQLKKYREIWKDADNVLIAMLKILDENCRMIDSLCPRFFQDMDSLFPELKENYAAQSKEKCEFEMYVFREGIIQGLFRADVDFERRAKILEVQLVAMKRYEDLYPKDIRQSEVIYSLLTGFLSSICTPKGHQILDRHLIGAY